MRANAASTDSLVGATSAVVGLIPALPFEGAAGCGGGVAGASTSAGGSLSSRRGLSALYGLLWRLRGSLAPGIDQRRHNQVIAIVLGDLLQQPLFTPRRDGFVFRIALPVGFKSPAACRCRRASIGCGLSPSSPSDSLSTQETQWTRPNSARRSSGHPTPGHPAAR